MLYATFVREKGGQKSYLLETKITDYFPLIYIISYMERTKPYRVLVLFVLFVSFTAINLDRGCTMDLEQTCPSIHGKIGVYLTSRALTKPEVIDKLLAAIDAGQINAVVINVKNMHGEITYASSVPVAAEIGAASDRSGLVQFIEKLQQKGVYLIARQVLFYDPMLARYLGSPSVPWVLPSDERAVSYNLAVAREVIGLGFDEIQFDYVRFPDGGELVSQYEDRYAAVNSFLERAREALSARVALSIDVFGRVLWDWNKKKIDPIGQSLEEIAEHVDLISPMLYPSHYHEYRYRNDPYAVVKEALKTGKARVSTPFRPFLQAFDQAIPARMTLEDYIRAQILAAVELHSDGYLFWNPSCEYTALYRVLQEETAKAGTSSG